MGSVTPQPGEHARRSGSRVVIALLVAVAAGWIAAVLDGAGSPTCVDLSSESSIANPSCVGEGLRVWLVGSAAVLAGAITWVVLDHLRNRGGEPA